jgi:hypothetical protein
MGQTNNIELASQTFEKIQNMFPNLTMTIDRDPEHVELSMDILKQPGLDFDINLNLQNEDELHISTKDIWCEWFPLTDQVIEEYVDAAKGLITGEYRILKFSKAEKDYKSLLQKPIDNEWKTIFRHITKFSFPWTKLETQIIQNTKLPTAMY